MFITTTNSIENHKVEKYYGVVAANVVIGTNIFSDISASFTDFFGGRSESYQNKLQLIYKEVTAELEQKAYRIGANCILGLKIDFDEISGGGKSMFMVSAYGTAITLKDNCDNNLDQDITADFLANEIKKNEIIKKTADQKGLNEDDWLFILRNNFPDISDYIIDKFIIALGKKDGDLYLSDRLLLSNTVQYFSILDPIISKDKLYGRIPSNGMAIVDIILKCNLFDSIKITQLINDGYPSIATNLLEADQYKYSREDVVLMNSIIDAFNNIPDVGAIKLTKDGVFSKEKDMYVCSKGHKSDVSFAFCHECMENIKGLTPQDLGRIDKFKDKIAVLTGLFR